MTYRLAVEPQAAADLEEIFAYLASHNIATARRFMEAAADTANEIREDPKIGMAWHSRRSELAGVRYKRVRYFKKYFIFYRERADCIEVIRVLHGARDIESLLPDR